VEKGRGGVRVPPAATRGAGGVLAASFHACLANPHPYLTPVLTPVRPHRGTPADTSGACPIVILPLPLPPQPSLGKFLAVRRRGISVCYDLAAA
jgi:hypothetical protein